MVWHSLIMERNTNTGSSQVDINKMSKDELETAMICDVDDSVYRTMDEARFLDGGYSAEELRAIIANWIMECPDC